MPEFPSQPERGHDRGGEVVGLLGPKRENHGTALKASSREEYFSVPDYTADALLEAAKREALLVRP